MHVVVGAGMSGLAYAWARACRGDEVVLLEASERAGGVLRTDERDGYRIERAATTIPSTAVHLRALLDSLPRPPSLHPAAPASRKQFLLRRRGLCAVPRGPGQILRGEVLRPGHALGALAELLRGPRRAVGRESLHTFTRRRFGGGIAERMLRPFTSGIYAASPERLGAADAFPRLAALERRRGSVLRGLLATRGGARRSVLLPAGGMEAVVRALEAALGPRVRLGARVARLVPGDRERPAHVHLDDGSTLAADEVALAVPARAQARLLGATRSHVTQALAAVDYAPMAVVAVGFAREDGPAVPDGFGFLRGPDAGVRILGATFNARMTEEVAPPGHELLTVYLGGTEDRGAVELDDAALRALVLRDLRVALGGRVQPTLLDAWRWPAAVPVPAPGHRGRMARAAAALASGRIRLLGSHVTGVSLEDCVRPWAPLRAPLPAGLVRV